MTENEINLLAVFEERVHELIVLCDKMKSEIKTLKKSIDEKDETIRQAKQKIGSLQSKYTNLLTAQTFASDDDELQKARMRVNKLVREVETCIALLNE